VAARPIYPTALFKVLLDHHQQTGGETSSVSTWVVALFFLPLLVRFSELTVINIISA